MVARCGAAAATSSPVDNHVGPLQCESFLPLIAPTATLSTFVACSVSTGSAIPCPGEHPSSPVFDQIVDGTLWSAVNNTGNYVNGNSTFYEGFFLGSGEVHELLYRLNRTTHSNSFHQ
ncbi:putative LRR receptor-like serine/threonine-protein [Sesbania bispinosa]|nr:putative LRR receptor-like serine/threonine-protein [Sesbania bispinosa]